MEASRCTTSPSPRRQRAGHSAFTGCRDNSAAPGRFQAPFVSNRRTALKCKRSRMFGITRGCQSRWRQAKRGGGRTLARRLTPTACHGCTHNSSARRLARLDTRFSGTSGYVGAAIRLNRNLHLPESDRHGFVRQVRQHQLAAAVIGQRERGDHASLAHLARADETARKASYHFEQPFRGTACRRLGIDKSGGSTGDRHGKASECPGCTEGRRSTPVVLTSRAESNRSCRDPEMRELLPDRFDEYFLHRECLHHRFLVEQMLLRIHGEGNNPVLR